MQCTLLKNGVYSDSPSSALRFLFVRTAEPFNDQ